MEGSGVEWREGRGDGRWKGRMDFDTSVNAGHEIKVFSVAGRIDIDLVSSLM